MTTPQLELLLERANSLIEQSIKAKIKHHQLLERSKLALFASYTMRAASYACFHNPGSILKKCNRCLQAYKPSEWMKLRMVGFKKVRFGDVDDDVYFVMEKFLDN